nr:ARID DNA-binding domain-containing protein [Tanacetum cinerariifolium]
TSHQSDFAEIRTPNVEATKGKEKMKHFRIELEDTSYESDNLSPIHPSIKERQTMSKDNQGVIKGPIQLESEVKEDINSSSSEDFTINEGIEKNGNRSETEKAKNEVLMASKPSVSIKYLESIHLETKCMLKGTDQGHWDDIQRGHVIKNCPMKKQNEGIEKNGNRSETEKAKNEVLMASKPSGVSYAPEVTINILLLELLERQGFEIVYEYNTCSLVYMFKDPKEQNKPVGLVSMEDDVIEIKGTLYSTRVTTFNEYVGFLNLVKQDEIVSQEWDKFRTGEILGLSKQDEEEIKRCYINYFDVFTSYYKTARVTTRNVEEGNGVNCLTSHQSDFAEIRTPNVEATKRKEKMKHFGIELEDTSYESDNLSPIHPSIKERQTMSKDNQGVIKGPIQLESEVKEDINSSSSEDFTIVA